MMKLLITRHGESEMNRAKIVQSRTHGDLTSKGVMMAEKLGISLQGEKFTRIYSSDLRRCTDTTLNILKTIKTPQPDPIYDPDLRERDYGDLEFQPNMTMDEIRKATGLMVHAIPVPNGEPYENCVSRASKFFQMLCKLTDACHNENVLVVTHGGWIMCLMDYILRNTNLYSVENVDHSKLRMSPTNTCTTTLIIHRKNITDASCNEAQPRRIEFLSMFDMSHLRDISWEPEDY